MNPYEIAAVGAALCWAVSGMISINASRHLGAIAFNRYRMLMVFGMLAVAAAITGGWNNLDPRHVPILVLSGFIGIFLGDTALFLTLNRLGPRRTGYFVRLECPHFGLARLDVFGGNPVGTGCIRHLHCNDRRYSGYRLWQATDAIA